MSNATASSSAIKGTSLQHPHDRQIIACLGNRHVLFGSRASLPNRRELGPEDVKVRHPRVTPDHDEAELRIIETLVVEGFEVQASQEGRFGDVAIVDADGQCALVEIKAGDRDFAGVDLGRAWMELAPAAEAGERREIWAFNAERLNLGIVWSEGRLSPSFVQLPALNVWEFGDDGSVFDRRQVVQEVDDWVSLVEAVYADVELWAKAEGLTARRDRIIPMSEELMQNFAVPDRDMPILDLDADGKPVVSMVPVGLWFIGFKGMIDIITRNGTFRLGAVPQAAEPPKWIVIDGKTRTRTDWSREVFRSVIGLVAVGE